MMVYLYAEAVNKNEDFTSGMMIIKDPGFRLYNFMLNYVMSEYKGNPYHEVIVTTQKVYPRRSSHFNHYYRYTGKAVAQKGLLKKGYPKKDRPYMHYGIDLTDKAIQLPGKKRHFFFGKVDERSNRMFIKFEFAGLSAKGWAQHAVGLIKGKTRKLLPPMITKLKKQLNIRWPEAKKLNSWIDNFEDSIETDDKTYYRKERIPLDLLAAMGALLLAEEANIPEEKIKELGKMFKALGIQAMNQVARSYKDSNVGTPAWRRSMRDFSNELFNQFDYVPSRFGREVIFTDVELFTSLYYYADSLDEMDPLKGHLPLIRALFNNIIGIKQYIKDLKLGKAHAERAKLHTNYEAFKNIQFNASPAVINNIDDIVLNIDNDLSLAKLRKLQQQTSVFRKR